MTTVNHCLDAAKACNVDDLCQKLRTEYVSACIKPTAKSGLCNRPKCNKALRRFFDRVPADYTHELLFCPCTDTACAERRRQTIVPSCSYESAEKPSCITQMRACNADYVCRLEPTDSNSLSFNSMSTILISLTDVTFISQASHMDTLTYCCNMIMIHSLGLLNDPLLFSRYTKSAKPVFHHFQFIQVSLG